MAELRLTHQKIVDIKSVKELQALKNLNVLDLSHNSITKIEPLANIGKTLTHLSFAMNRIAQITSLQVYVALKTLDLSNNQLTSLNGLSALPSLLKLSAPFNRIRSIHVLAFPPPRLRFLDLRGNKIEYKELDVLKKCFELEEVLFSNDDGTQANQCCQHPNYKDFIDSLGFLSLLYCDGKSIKGKKNTHSSLYYEDVFPQCNVEGNENNSETKIEITSNSAIKKSKSVNSQYSSAQKRNSNFNSVFNEDVQQKTKQDYSSPKKSENIGILPFQTNVFDEFDDEYEESYYAEFSKVLPKEINEEEKLKTRLKSLERISQRNTEEQTLQASEQQLQIIELKSENTRLKTALSSSMEQYSKALHDIEDLRSQSINCASLKNETKAAYEQLTSAHELCVGLEDELNRTKKKIKALRISITSFGTDSSETIKKLKTGFDKLTLLADRTKRCVEFSKKVQSKLEEKERNKADKDQQSFAQMISQIKEERNELKKENDELIESNKEEKQRMIRQVFALKEAFSDKEREMKVLEKELTESHKREEEALETAKEIEKIVRMQQREKKADKKGTEKELRQIVEHQKAQLSQANEKIVFLEKTIANYQSQFSSFELTRKTAKDELLKLTNKDTQELLQERYDKSQKEINKLERALERATTIIEEREERIRELFSELKEIEQRKEEKDSTKQQFGLQSNGSRRMEFFRTGEFPFTDSSDLYAKLEAKNESERLMKKKVKALKKQLDETTKEYENAFHKLKAKKDSMKKRFQIEKQQIDSKLQAAIQEKMENTNKFEQENLRLSTQLAEEKRKVQQSEDRKRLAEERVEKMQRILQGI